MTLNEFDTHTKLYHINVIGGHNPYAALKLGDKLSTHTNFNPFFLYYQNPFTLQYKKQTGEISRCSPLSMFNNLYSGTLYPDVVPPTYFELAKQAFDFACEYVKFSKELLWELIREREFNFRPSRMKCIWLFETLSQSEAWIKQLGAQIFQIFEVELLEIKSIFRINEKFFTMQNEGYSVLEERAREYWCGVDQVSNSTEILFEGTLEVKRLSDVSDMPEMAKCVEQNKAAE